MKSRVYANKPQTIPELNAEIRRVIGGIEPQLCGNIIENFVKRARVWQQSRGGYLSDIVFHNKSKCVYFVLKEKYQHFLNRWCVLLQN